MATAAVVALNAESKPEEASVRRKYGVSCGSSPISPAVAPVMARVGIQCCPLATLAGKAHVGRGPSSKREAAFLTRLLAPRATRSCLVPPHTAEQQEGSRPRPRPEPAKFRRKKHNRDENATPRS